METKSIFQQKYPLSRRKFWKKMLRAIFPLLGPVIIISVAVGVMSSLFFTIGFQNPNDPNLIQTINPVAFPLIGMLTSVAIIFFIIFGIYLIIYGFYVRAYIRNYFYDCGDQFITIKKGVFAPAEIHVLYSKIQDVYVDQDILDRMMGLYDVHIGSATITSGIEAHIDGVNHDNAEAIKNYLLNKVQNNVPAQTMAPTSPTSITAPPQPLNAEEKISSLSYPISKNWVISQILSSLIGSFFAALFICIWVSTFLQAFISGMSNTMGIVGVIIIFAAIFFVLFIIIFIGTFTFTMIWKKNYYFEFMPEYVLMRTGILGRRENHLPYKSIQNVMMRQSFFERMFGIASVSIENAAQGIMPVNNRGGYAMGGSGVVIVGLTYEKAQQLNEILNKITASHSNPGAMGL